MSRLLLNPLLICCLIVGCTSGTDSTIPPTRTGLQPNVPLSGIFQAEFITTEGKFLVEVNREWAPIGADRFYKLVQDKFFDDAGFFRVVPGFVVQFGLPADPSQNAKWSQGLTDEPILQGNQRGFLTYAKSGPNTRTTQLFISYGDNSRLDGMGFSAFGQVIEGMDVVDKINSEYGEQPQQPSIEIQGNVYLNSCFPNLSYIQTARITQDDLHPQAAVETESNDTESGDTNANTTESKIEAKPAAE